MINEKGTQLDSVNFLVLEGTIAFVFDPEGSNDRTSERLEENADTPVPW